MRCSHLNRALGELMEYHYTNNDRLMQLNDLKGRLKLLIAHLQLNHNDAKIISIYERALFDVDELICNGLTKINCRMLVIQSQIFLIGTKIGYLP